MTLTEILHPYIAACFTGIWIESHEHQDALSEIAQLCRQEEWRLATWDLEQGMRIGVGQPATAPAVTDPLAAVRAVGGLAPAATPDGRPTEPQTSSILVLMNFHRFMQSAEIVQALVRQLIEGKDRRTFLVILSPVVQIPVELEKLFTVIEHPLPDRRQLATIAEGIATETGELPTGPERERLLDASASLTRCETENAFSLSLERHGRLQAETLWELKSQMLKKSGLVTLHRGGERFDGLGGLESLKAFCKRAIRPRSPENKARPRGVLLLSPPGCGKSQFAKALGNETGRPTLVLNIGSLMGSLVGQSEANIRQALQIADAMAPAVLFLDECE